MPEIQQDTIIGSWVRELGRSAVFPPPEYFCVYPSAEANREFSVRTAEDGALTVKSNRSKTVVELGRFIGKTRSDKNYVVLLNGDGFADRELERIQAEVRRRVGNEFVNFTHRMIVPYAALNSAGLKLDTIEPIHISRDRQQSRQVQIEKPSQKVLDQHIPTEAIRRLDFSWRGRSYRADRAARYGHAGNHETFTQYNLLHRAEFAAQQMWHQVDTTSEDGHWYVTETVHRLGACVFSAEGQDGVRHRWLSAFDQNENPPMYFLAQLPDKGGIRYITHAFRLLAPPIVQRAQREGRAVFRQGDIFAVATELTDEDFASHTVAYRTGMFVDIERVDETRPTWDRRRTRIVPELTDLGRANRAWRRAIQIYGTSHTADQVVVTSYGTFIKGVMHHDPILENIRGNREPEHAPLPLPVDVWFLCVRNQVPRRLNQQGGDSNAPDGTDRVPVLPQRHRRQNRRVPQPVVR